MNPGILSVLIAAMFIVLLATGWKREMMDRVPVSIMVLFIIGWLLLHSHSWMWNGVSVNGSYVLALLAAIGAWMLTGDGANRLHLLSVSFLIAAVYVFFVQLYRTSPVLVLFGHTADLAVLSAVAAMMFCRRALEQWIVLTLGLWIGDALLSHLWGMSSKPQLGAPGLFDLWWLAFGLARLLSVVAERLYVKYQSRFGRLAERKE
ncbi:hypothetical protein DUZ99_10710 [Xylanibacillus composti]|uniref:Uncharacterized protein n=1 Tax=Xylanibacillus composti TaxID=1572762 RepID=A0A8J4H928_9BACL|nr:hypothetical protein [Xylanibacillus composti]MDT9725441.1 hypothetical protein [Xylanibacillus composti]GIQ71043.1 hypothetical protein XYCOK13_38670 [Xylanibacillus composti]